MNALLNALGRSLTIAIVLGGSLDALAGFTSPKLALLGAAGIVADGARSATIQVGDLTAQGGDLDFPNAVQGGTAVHLVMWQGTSFVRYPLHGPAVGGTSATLADNQVDDLDVATLLGEGSPAATGVRIVSLSATTLVVTLPAGFTAGSCFAQLIALPTEGAVVSNVVPFTLP